MNSTPPINVTRRTCPASSNSIVYMDDGTSSTRPKVVPSSQQLSHTQQQQQCSASYRIADKISIIQVMKRQESTVYKPSFYFDRTAVTPQDRAQLCRWGFDIMEACNLNLDVAVIAIGYFDRFLSNRGVRVVEACLSNQRELQLAFVACLVIALKGRGSLDVKPKFVAEKMCDNMYHPEEIIGMELEVLRTLGWFLNGPSARDFIEHFIELLPTETDEVAASTFFEKVILKSELCLLDYSMALETPSRLAVACVASVMSTLTIQEQNALGASTWMARIGFVMGATFCGEDGTFTEHEVNVTDDEAAA